MINNHVRRNAYSILDVYFLNTTPYIDNHQIQMNNSLSDIVYLRVRKLHFSKSKLYYSMKINNIPFNL